MTSPPGESVSIEVEVRYQACDEQVCYLPALERIEIELPLGAKLRPECVGRSSWALAV